MKGAMNMVKSKVKVNSYGQMDQFLKVASTTMILKAQVLINGQMEEYSLVNMYSI